MKTEQTNTPDPQLREQLDAKSKKFDEACDNNDAAAVAALFTEGGHRSIGSSLEAAIEEPSFALPLRFWHAWRERLTRPEPLSASHSRATRFL
jgi:hypothetical protein